jgi:DNA-binding transcriptional regulator YiaG
MPRKSNKAPDASEPLNIAVARVRLGEIWGLGRPLTKQELGRALNLSPQYGGEHVAKWESGRAPVSGTAEVALRMMLNGARPHTMDDVILPGYPRGEVRV